MLLQIVLSMVHTTPSIIVAVVQLIILMVRTLLLVGTRTVRQLLTLFLLTLVMPIPITFITETVALQRPLHFTVFI